MPFTTGVRLHIFVFEIASADCIFSDFKGQTVQSVSTARTTPRRTAAGVTAMCVGWSRTQTSSCCVMSVTWPSTSTASTRRSPPFRMMRTGQYQELQTGLGVWCLGLQSVELVVQWSLPWQWVESHFVWAISQLMILTWGISWFTSKINWTILPRVYYVTGILAVLCSCCCMLVV